MHRFREIDMWDYMNHYGGMGFGMGFGMLIFWGLLIAVIAVLFRGTCRTGNPEPKKSALDILEERYARGEIGREEFEQKKHDLEK